MKKVICFLTLLLITLFCGCTNSSSDYIMPDLSYEHINELNYFKCYASYLDKSTTIEGEEAKKLYKVVTGSCDKYEHYEAPSQSNYIYLVFYNSTDVYPDSDKVTEFYGCFYIFPDGLLQFADSPYYSVTFPYQTKKSVFTSVREKTFP